MENLGDVLSHYRHDKFAVLLRELLDATYLVDSCMLSMLPIRRTIPPSTTWIWRYRRNKS